VSIIAICYNHERFARGCLDSIAAQTYPNVEIILLDDASTDGSRAVLNTWLDDTGTQATLIEHEQNLGICRSRNETLRLARGEFVACISTDDEWLPHKLETQVEQLQQLDRSTAVVYSDAELMDESGAVLDGMFVGRNRDFDRPPAGYVFDDLLVGNFIPSLATLVRRRCIEKVGSYDESLVYEDWDMWLRLSRRYEFAFTPTVTARYRIVTNSLIAVLHEERKIEFFESSLRLMSKHLDVGERARSLIRFRMDELGYSLDLLGLPAYETFLARLDAFGDPAVHVQGGVLPGTGGSDKGGC
jgi:glycosyltransferase involved in cell wall biosynthesis